MKTAAAFALCTLGAAVLLPAQALAQSTPTPALTALPPPSINAPGIKPVASASLLAPAGSQSTPAPASTAMPLPALHGSPSHDALGEAPPTVKVVKHDGKRITQYYEGGQLYMVQVHPKHGVTYTYFVDKAHHLKGVSGAPPINPVMYTILTWGGPDDE